MPLRTIATLAVAVVLGLLAVFLINLYMGSSHKSQPGQTQAVAMTPVVVAAAPIKRGIVVQPALLKVVSFPSDAVPVGSFTAISQLTGGKDVQRVATRDLAVNEAVLSTRLTAPGQSLTLATELDPGTQAIAIKINDVTGVGGFVLPNDRVDVLLSRAATGEGRQALPLTQMVAQDVRVLAVDQSDDQEATKPVVVKAITLEVTPQQAQAITLAQTMGELSLSLRHVDDSLAVTRVATTAGVFGFRTPPPAAHAAHRPLGPTVRVTRATDTTVYQLAAR